MLNHHFATRAPNHRDLRAPRARALRSAYPQRRSEGGRRAPRTERKVLGSAGCSSHASRYRIPQRSRRDHSERFLLAPSRPRSLRMLSLPRRAASREPPSGRLSGFSLEPDKAWNRGRPRHRLTGGTECSRGAAGAGPPGLPERGGTLLGHAGFTRESGYVYLVCVSRGQGTHEYCEGTRGHVCEGAPIGCRSRRCRCWNKVRRRGDLPQNESATGARPSGSL